MLRRTLLYGAIVATLPLSAGEGSYDEPYRPQYHFSPAQNFMNDPNGLVYYKGEYHLFYQHNPFGNEWGHMSWGHAVSSDLVHWTHLPVALREEDGIMMFSGSAAVDWRNSSGLCRGADEPACLVALYTGHGHGLQTQNLAYSNDRGRTWTKYSGNPVLDIGSNEFRDPKLIWHEATRKWIQVVVLAKEKKVSFYGSANLKDWEHLSDFGPAGATGGVWECPDLFQLPVEGLPGRSKWVLIVNINPGAVAGGSGTQYFVGEFDGKTFVSDDPGGEPLWADYGRDFYAAVSWSDMPASDGRRIWIGWMSNWDYANKAPTHPWRSAQSLPRVLRLEKLPEGVRLVQAPVEELRALRADHRHFENFSVSGLRELEGVSGELLEIEAEIDLGSAEQFAMLTRRGKEEETVVGWRVLNSELFVDRTRSGKSDFAEDFAGVQRAPLALEGGRLKLHVFVDRSSVEVFAQGGRRVITDLIFPRSDSVGFAMRAEGGEARVARLDVWTLRPAWR